MAFYLSGSTLKEAVERLSASRARPSLCDFLIVKRAMTRGDGTVTLSLVDETYTNAVYALTAVVTVVDDGPLPPYFNPFGTRRERTRGWRTDKYPSNGPPVTVTGSGWTGVIEILSARPRRVRLTEDYLEHLAAVIARSDGPAPLLEDCAVWLHRMRLISGEAADGVPLDRMIATFLEETGLSDDERNLIFGEE